MAVVRLLASLAEVVKWQTRYVQGVVSASSWGFKSPLRQIFKSTSPMSYSRGNA